MNNNYDVFSTIYFDRKYKAIIKHKRQLKEKIDRIIETLSDSPFDASLNTHKVTTRQFKSKWSSKVTGDIRIIWEFRKNTVRIIDLYDIGGHEGKNKVYN